MVGDLETQDADCRTIASAGGNLAAVVALMARDRGGPQLVCRVLSVPVTYRCYEGAIHMVLRPEAMDDLTAYLRERLA